MSTTFTPRGQRAVAVSAPTVTRAWRRPSARPHTAPPPAASLRSVRRGYRWTRHAVDDERRGRPHGARARVYRDERNARAHGNSRRTVAPGVAVHAQGNALLQRQCERSRGREAGRVDPHRASRRGPEPRAMRAVKKRHGRIARPPFARDQAELRDRVVGKREPGDPRAIRSTGTARPSTVRLAGSGPGRCAPRRTGTPSRG